MNKFKVGDKVKRVNRPHPVFPIGYEGVVVGVSNNGYWISVDHFALGFDHFPLNVCNFELIEEKQMNAPVLKNMKIRIKDAIHSRMVQEALFERGCAWASCGKEVSFTEKEALWVDGNTISFSNLDSFDKYPNEEVELVTTCSFKPVDQEAKRKAAEKEALQKNVAEMQKQLDEMKQKLESMT